MFFVLKIYNKVSSKSSAGGSFDLWLIWGYQLRYDFNEALAPLINEDFNY